jgi:hypothetical protein
MKHHGVQRFAVISAARQVILLPTRKCAPAGPKSPICLIKRDSMLLAQIE